MIDDMDVAFLRLYLEEHYGLRSEKLIYPALNIVSTAQAFHPVRDRLNSLVWDGVPRVRMALHHFLGAEVSDANEKYLRTFMLGAVNRVFHPGCKFELMLVLVGGQGAGAGMVHGRCQQIGRQGDLPSAQRSLDLRTFGDGRDGERQKHRGDQVLSQPRQGFSADGI